MTKPNLLK